MVSSCRTSKEIIVAPELKGSFLLYNGNFDHNNINIILASVKSLQYVDMKSTMKRVFNKQNPGGKIETLNKGNRRHSIPTGENTIKHIGRPSQYTDVRKLSSHGHSSRRNHSNHEYNSSHSHSSRGNYSRENNFSQPQIKSTIKRVNPMQRGGKRRSICVICKSPDHWTYTCPDNDGRGRRQKVTRNVYHGEHQTPKSRSGSSRSVIHEEENRESGDDHRSPHPDQYFLD